MKIAISGSSRMAASEAPGGSRCSASPLLVDNVQRVLDGEQQHSQEQDRARGFEWDHEFSGGMVTLSCKANRRKITRCWLRWHYARVRSTCWERQNVVDGCNRTYNDLSTKSIRGR
jgi:hypothetical protein